MTRPRLLPVYVGASGTGRRSQTDRRARPAARVHRYFVRRKGFGTKGVDEGRVTPGGSGEEVRRRRNVAYHLRMRRRALLTGTGSVLAGCILGRLATAQPAARLLTRIPFLDLDPRPVPVHSSAGTGLDARQFTDLSSLTSETPSGTVHETGSSPVYRVEARVRALMGDLYRATEAYERALALSPDSARLHYFYGSFLFADVQDATAAHKHLAEAERLDPRHPAVTAAVAKVLKLQGHYDESAARYERVLAKPQDISRTHRVAVRDQAADCYRQWMERDSEQGNEAPFLQHFERAMQILQEAARRSDEIDIRTEIRLASVIDGAMDSAVTQFGSTSADRIAATLCGWPTDQRGAVNRWAEQSKPLPAFAEHFPAQWLNILEKFPGLHEIETPGDVEGSVYGSIRSLKPTFGFITDDQERDWFFHTDQCKPRRLFSQLASGSRVVFRIGSHSKGPCAVAVRAAVGGGGPQGC